MSPSVSVLMTVYNREAYVAAAIESALAQTHPDFELLIWDDGSTDRSLKIIQKYSAKDKRIKVFAEPHHGRAFALKQVTAQASGPYIAWLDSDDILLPETLTQTIPILDNNPNAGFVYTNHDIIDKNGKLISKGRRCDIAYTKDRLLVEFMTFHFRLIRRTTYDKVGGINDSFQAAIDYDLCLRLSEVAEVIHYPQSLYQYRVHGNTISSEKRLEQLLYSHEASNQALKRRGLDKRYYVGLELMGKYNLFERAKSDSQFLNTSQADLDKLKQLVLPKFNKN